MVIINQVSKASPSIRLVMKMFKHVEMRLPKKTVLALKACLDFAKQTGVSMTKFYFYNLIQIPIFITMVFSIRKIATENDDLAGQGLWWFKDLNEMDPYMILPIVSSIFTYVNLILFLFC